MYGPLGFDLLETLKEAASAGLQATKTALLTRGGEAIAATPEGQAAMERNLLARARAQAGGVFGAIPTPVLYGAAALVVFLMVRRRR